MVLLRAPTGLCTQGAPPPEEECGANKTPQYPPASQPCPEKVQSVGCYCVLMWVLSHLERVGSYQILWYPHTGLPGPEEVQR